MQRWARCRMIGSCEEVMTHAPEGDWVLHSDAAALIAAKDAEIERLTRERDEANYRAKNHGDALSVACRGTPHRSAMELRSALDDAARRLALAVAEVAKWREGHDADNDDGGPFIVYAENVTPCEEEMCEYMKQLDAARSATDADPVLRQMIGGG